MYRVLNVEFAAHDSEAFYRLLSRIHSIVSLEHVYDLPLNLEPKTGTGYFTPLSSSLSLKKENVNLLLGR
jgi:hypothetical protein